MRFEWDANKVASNFLKHGVSLNEAIEVFYDPNAVEGYDAAHSSVEARFFIMVFRAVDCCLSSTLKANKAQYG